MARPGLVLLTGCRHLGQSERPYRLQQPPPADPPAQVYHEALVRQPAEQVRDARPVPADRRRGVDVERPDEHPESAEQRLLLLTEQVIAPGQHRAQGPVPLVAAAHAGQQPQRVVEGREQTRRAQRRGAGRGQLDRQGQPVQPRAQFRDHRRLRHEMRVRGQRPVAE